MTSFKNMTIKDLQSVKDAIADVICWHYGFSAAKPEYDAPPQLYILREFSSRLQDYIDDEEDNK